MKLIRAGYPGSTKITFASRYLVKKYTPFEDTEICYTGNIEKWSEFIADYLKTLDDEYIVFALDDYLLAAPLNQEVFDNLLKGLKKYPNINAKLCECTEQEQREYPVTTQYTIWPRKYLISILERTTTPWDFEIKGSQLLKEDNFTAIQGPALTYYTNSSLSKRWVGVRLDGLNEEDIKEVQKLLI